jgi:hypothetical protein
MQCRDGNVNDIAGFAKSLAEAPGGFGSSSMIGIFTGDSSLSGPVVEWILREP